MFAGLLSIAIIVFSAFSGYTALASKFSRSKTNSGKMNSDSIFSKAFAAKEAYDILVAPHISSKSSKGTGSELTK